MRKFIALVLVSTALTGCLGSGKKGPNEMAVLDSVPLTLPPNFELRPPREGESRAVQMANAKAEALILGKNVEDEMKSQTPKAADNWLVEKAGGEMRNLSIRELMAEEARKNGEQEEKGVFSKLLDDTPEDPTLEELAEMQEKDSSVQ